MTAAVALATPRTLRATRRRAKLVGSPTPRLGPPVPAKHDLAGFRVVCRELGISPMPWQETAATYLEAQRPDGRHLYGEVAVIVARQNGKTTLLIPLITKRLRAG